MSETVIVADEPSSLEFRILDNDEIARNLDSEGLLWVLVVQENGERGLASYKPDFCTESPIQDRQVSQSL